MNRLGLACFGLCLPLAASAAADPVDKYIREEMAARKIPGAALLVMQGGRPVRTHCYGLANLELRTPVLPESVFEIGSVTKQFTASGIMLLVQDRKLSIEDLVSAHVKNTPAAWKGVTIRHLLTHTSGIKSYTGLSGFELTKRLSQEQFLSLIGTHPLEFDPGAKWKYSNTGYSLLGYVIENVAQDTYWNFMWKRVFQPTGMEFTTNRLPSLVIPNRVSGYDIKNGRHINRDYDLTDVFAAGALVSTVGDLGRWVAALDAGGIVSVASRQAMWTSAKLNDGTDTGYGFGWRVETTNGKRNIGHGGSTSGFSATLQLYPDDKFAVILLTNTEEQVATGMARKIAELLLPTPSPAGS